MPAEPMTTDPIALVRAEIERTYQELHEKPEWAFPRRLFARLRRFLDFLPPTKPAPREIPADLWADAAELLARIESGAAVNPGTPEVVNLRATLRSWTPTEAPADPRIERLREAVARCAAWTGDTMALADVVAAARALTAPKEEG